MYTAYADFIVPALIFLFVNFSLVFYPYRWQRAHLSSNSCPRLVGDKKKLLSSEEYD